MAKNTACKYIISRDVINGGVWHLKREIVRQIMHYIKHYKENQANPFKWIYAGK